jgi:hypothetical protein
MSQRYDPVTDEPWVCRTCRRPLDGYEQRDPDGTLIEFRWQHTFQDLAQGLVDHPADPVRLADSGGEIVGTCDFCSQPGCDWIYPCDHFNIGGYGSVGPWGACTPCHKAIQRSDWTTLTNRAVASQPKHLRPAARKWVLTLHRAFRQHQHGDPKPAH